MPVIDVNGVYTGKNLYVQNPYAANGAGFCVTEVKVNGNVTVDSLQASAFEIDLARCGLKQGDAVEVQIYHKDGCQPKVLNPEVLKPRT